MCQMYVPLIVNSSYPSPNISYGTQKLFFVTVQFICMRNINSAAATSNSSMLPNVKGDLLVMLH